MEGQFLMLIDIKGLKGLSGRFQGSGGYAGVETTPIALCRLLILDNQNHYVV